ncbi:ABC transporter ATP-binding protein [Rhodospirillum rubrum]|uniref:ABC transporter ATP-binding protein n=1 Tax=Rhodospirillum rubrum TaxID=1085 RepID=UPI001906DF48|nr:ABC transporter ATP-binding protein [Rhodospirillum rubrum]MBK1664919.1 ABC transporter ATP-binding protein [Rhodospirillum rubrum]MBK1676110.1 ABC transporter ATP-binding protein [Rhodospirillum rubrum]
MTLPLVEARSLSKSFGEGELASQVLKRLSFDINAGERVALVGPSGSGKSTLLAVLGTLLGATSGDLRILGQPMIGLPEAELARFRNRNLGFVFQFHHLLPDFTALENVLFPAAAGKGRETRLMRERARALLVRVGLEDRVDYGARKLSGGQKQRVALARALINRPALVLADEPTGNLDSGPAEQVMDLLGEINDEDGTTFLISTHDAAVAARCTRRMELLDGRLVGQDPAD